MHDNNYSIYKQALFGFGKPKPKYTDTDIALDTLTNRLSPYLDMPYTTDIKLGKPVKYRFADPSVKYAPHVGGNDPGSWLRQLIDHNDEHQNRYNFNLSEYIPKFVLKNRVLSLPIKGYYRYGDAADTFKDQYNANALVHKAFKDRPDIVSDFKELESSANNAGNLYQAALLLPSLALGYRFGRNGYRAGIDAWDDKKPIRSALYTAYKTLVGGSLGSLLGGGALWMSGLPKMLNEWKRNSRSNSYYATKSKQLVQKLKDINTNPDILKSLEEQRKLLEASTTGKKTDTKKDTSKTDTKKDTSKSDTTKESK